MKDKEFLEWLFDRLVMIHNENPFADHMGKLSSIINVYDPEKNTPNMGIQHYKRSTTKQKEVCDES